jgi:Holliday junction resolvasome RuvABC endonuclease subunit
VIRRPSPAVIPAVRRAVLGIDPSLSSTGYSYWHGARLVTGCIESGKLRGPHRLFYIRMQVGKLLDACQPTLVAMEDYAMGARGNNMFHIGELGGVLKTLVWDRGIDILPIPPTVMKSIIAMNGRAEKQHIMTALQVRFGITLTQHDEADAAGLMVVGEMRCGLRKANAKDGKSDRFAAVRDCELVKGRLQLISTAGK